MAEIITRRSFLRVLTGIIAAPALIQVASLMPLRGEALIIPDIKAIDDSMYAAYERWSYCEGLVQGGHRPDGIAFPWDDKNWKSVADAYEPREVSLARVAARQREEFIARYGVAPNA